MRNKRKRGGVGLKGERQVKRAGEEIEAFRSKRKTGEKEDKNGRKKI